MSWMQGQYDVSWSCSVITLRSFQMQSGESESLSLGLDPILFNIFVIDLDGYTRLHAQNSQE